MQLPDRDFVRLLNHWRHLILLTALAAGGAGSYVELAMDKSHALPWAALGCALFGVTGAFAILFFNRRISWMGHAVPGWIAGPAILLIGGWLFDFRHGMVLSHQYANWAAFAAGAAIGGLQFALIARKSGTRSGEAGALRPESPAGIKRKPRTTTKDLPSLIRELVLALNNGFHMTERQKSFVEDNLLAAINGLIQVKRFDKAAQLCRKVPSNWIRFDTALDGLNLEDGLRLANAAFKEDWGTALKILDWALKAHPSPALEARVFHTATLLAEQVRIYDDTFDAKVTALQLTPRLAAVLKATQVSRVLA